MNRLLTIVRLRWALTFATLHRSVWQVVGFVIGLMFGAGVVIGTGVVAWFAGIPFFRGLLPADLAANDAWMTAIMQPTMVVVGAMVTVSTALAQILVIGEGGTMNLRNFAIYGIPDRTLNLGLTLSTLCGVPSIVGMLSLTLWSMAYRRAGGLVVLTQIVAGVLAIVTIASIAKMLVALVGTLMRSKRSSNALYVIVTLLIVVAAQLPNMFAQSMASGRFEFSASGFSSAVGWLAWTPLSAAFQLPFDVLAGRWVALLVRMVILLVTIAACYEVGLWCLRRDRVAAPPAAAGARVKGAGAFGWMPDSRSGAISARVLTHLRHDPRQSMILIMPILFVVIFGIRTELPGFIWQSLIWGGLFMSITESNGLAYDGRGFTMQAQVGVPGRDDRLGRVRVYGVIATVYLGVLGLVILVVTGSAASVSGWQSLMTFLGAGLGTAYVGLGVAEVTSCLFLYPVASIDRPFSSPQGRALAQGFMPFLYMLIMLVMLVPTGVVAIMSLVVGFPGWIAGLVGLANGLLVLAVGVWLGGRVMDRRLPSIVATLQSLASLQK